MAKTVLLISYFAPPLINAESILVWKTLHELFSAFQVNVLTATLADNARIDPDMTFPHNTQVFRTSIYKPKNELLKKLSDKALGMVADEECLWASLGRVKPSDYDLIYSRSHPGASHILAYRLKQQTKKPWIAQFSDPWTGNPYHAHHTRIRKAFNAHWEEKVVRHADYLVFPTSEILAYYGQRYPAFDIASKSTVLPHHYLPVLYHPQSSANTSLDAGQAISFAYFGDFYGLRSPESFIKALSHIASTTPSLLNSVKVDFYGNVESKFADMVGESPVPIAQSRVTYFESLHLMTEYDVLLLIDAPSANGINPFLASKLVDYLGAGKRILGITDEHGTSADILRKYGHYVVSPHHIDGIVSALKACITTPEKHVDAPDEFTTQNVVGQLASLVNKLLK